MATPEGREPALEGSYTPETWGWRRVKGGPLAQDEFRPQGERIGRVDLENLYLEPDSSFTVAQKLGSDQGKPLEITAQTLGARLRDQGLLKRARDQKRDRVRVRVTVEGRRMACFHLKVESILSGDLTGESLSCRDQPDQEPMPCRQNRTIGPVAGPPKGPGRPSGSGNRTRTSGELVTLVTKKDGDGESAPHPPGEGSTLGHLPAANRTRKPDPPDQKTLRMEEGWL